ncbi:nickel/cobalt transporter [Microvirga antarctica]|uniref:nickel/cobalt transporter n=1 Tax=Microvirga antarctica TaxID=2819233 RepID=UPI001B308DCE|nr:nickel/cobalt transporter [Microvirga antarctica]
MSLNAGSAVLAPAARVGTWQRLLLCAAAVAIVGTAIALLVWIAAPQAAAPTRNPFGMGLREAAPGGELGAYLLAIQSGFYRSLQDALSAAKEHGTALWSLLGIGFAYGVFHAAGPGHGKGVIAAYLVADERALAKGFGLSLAAAIVQALVAILLVSVVALVFRATAATMNLVTVRVELLSFVVVALLGAMLTWRKSGKVMGTLALARDPLATIPEADCDHVHMPPPDVLDRMTRWRDMAGVALAAGIRPCAGALVILVFALSQGLFAAGVAATFAMALGTALTTGVIAALAVFAKALALRLAGGRGAAGAVAVAGLELLAAAFVLVLGASLLLGLWSAGPAS